MVTRLAILLQSSSACRNVALALVAKSLATGKFVFSLKFSLALSGFVPQNSSILQGFSFLLCLSLVLGANFLALLAFEDLVLLTLGGMKIGVYEVYEISFDIMFFLRSFIKCIFQSIFIVVVVIMYSIFVWI